MKKKEIFFRVLCSRPARNMEVFVPLAHKLQKHKRQIILFLGNVIVGKKNLSIE